MALLLKGDCLEVMKDLSANSIDCFICDLPYGCLSVNGKPKISKEKAKEIWGEWAKDKLRSYGNGCAWDVPLDLAEFWTQVKRLAKDDHTPVLMFCTTKFGADLINSNPKWFRYDLVWDKGRGVSFLSANKMPMRSHEMIYVFSKAGAQYERVDISGNYRPSVGGCKGSKVYNMKETTKGTGSTTKRCALSVIDIANSAGAGKHPTEKPVALYEWLIQRYCPAGGTILDPTAGSFNSVQAALNLGRKAIGIEKDDGFFEKARTRFAQQETNEIVE